MGIECNKEQTKSPETMELKKNKSADLNKKRFFFLLFSFVVVLTLVIMAFQWESNLGKEANYGIVDPVFEETIIIPQTKQELPPPPTPQPKQPKIKEVPDDVIIENPKIDFTSEITDETEIPALPVLAVEPPDEKVSEPPFVYVPEVAPSFPGGNAGINKFLQENIHYPEIATQIGTEGLVYVQFIINEKGNIDSVKVLKGIGSGCDEEAVRAVKLMKWSPGKQRGIPVKVPRSMPVRFSLRNF